LTMSATTETSTIVIRDIDGAELRAVEELQKEVWGIPDLDVVPLSQLVAAKAAGGVLLGAFDRETLIGFVYGFVSHEHGTVAHHSHMLAVRPSYRNHNLGYQLKLAQRDRVLAQSIKRITWTFDPLQSLNAYLNIAKLGVIADRYRVNYYGETTSFLHSAGTDRLWVTWRLNSERVRQRVEFGAAVDAMKLADFPVAVRVGENFEPEIEKAPLENPGVVIEIPDNINLLKQENPSLALKWREATRQIFKRLLGSGYIVAEFYRGKRAGQKICSYLLTPNRDDDPFR